MSALYKLVEASPEAFPRHTHLAGLYELYWVEVVKEVSD